MTGQRLSALLAKIKIIEQHGPADPLITSLAYDSREVEGGGLFFALKGLHSDGHDFIPAVVEKGAAAVVCMDLPDRLDPAVTYLRVGNSRTVMSPIAEAFYGDPSSDLTVIGITGTDGKSTTAYYTQQLLQMSGRKCGLLTTVQFDLGEGPQKNYLRQSTPEATDVHRLLREMLDNGCTHAVVEATSHGLSKVNNRLGDVKFNVGVLTNISHEHLEFHKTMERYINDKANLFRALPGDSGWAILNMDDAHRDAFLSATGCEVLGYGVNNPRSDLRAENIVESVGQQIFDIVHPEGKNRVSLNQPGRFNIENCLAALLAVSSATGKAITSFLPFIQNLKAIRGRMVPVDEGQPFEVLVDYAHTPGSFEKLFPQLRDRVKGRLIAVFGSAGERDREKRPILGGIAAAYCDMIVLSDEDPRGENPSSILEEIAGGCEGFERGKDLFLIADRPAAIAHAFSLAEGGDLVTLLGKGHEGSIIYANRTLEWDEEQQARKILRNTPFGSSEKARKI